MSMKIRPLIMNFQAKAESCSVSVWFSSIGTGIDIVTRRRIEALLEQDPAVVEVQPYLRGREGETELCIRVQDGGDIDRLFGALKAVASNGYLVGMRTEGGGEFQSTGNSKPK